MSSSAALLPLMIVSAPAIGATNLTRRAGDPGADILLSNEIIPVDIFNASQLQAVLESRGDSLQNSSGYNWTVAAFDGFLNSPIPPKLLANATSCGSGSSENSSGRVVCIPKMGAAYVKITVKVMDASFNTIAELDPGVCRNSNLLQTALTDDDQVALSCVVNGGFGGTPALVYTANGWVRIAEDTNSLEAVPHSALIVIGTLHLSDNKQSYVGSWFHHPSADENTGAIIIDAASGQRITTIAETQRMAPSYDGKLIVLYGHQTARIFRVEGTSLFPLFDLQTGRGHPFTAIAVNSETHAIVAQNDQTTAGFIFTKINELPPLPEKEDSQRLPP